MRAGDGGDGCVSVHREKFKPLGGPDGADGGKGGSVSLISDPNVTTLLDFHFHPHRQGGDGGDGAGDYRNGARGEDLYLPVPIGTVVKDSSGKILADLAEPGMELLVAEGGAGGLGNAALANRKRIAPAFHLLGVPGWSGDIVLELKTVADVAHEVGVPLIVDNTVATPYLIKPIDFGADVVVHSATKFLSGHGNAVVGAIVDAGTFDYAKYPAKFKGFNEPDPSYNGIVYSQALGVGSAFGANLSYIFKIRLQLLRDVGAAVAPFNAWLLAQGLETLSLRIERHVENAKAIATWLEAHPSVSKVNYASLASSPWNKLATKYAPKGSGAVLSFELKGGVEAGKKFVESLKLFSHVANIGDVRSLVIHPATTTHSQLSADEQLAAGVTPGLVRLSLGLENIEDLKADLEVGFAAAK